MRSEAELTAVEFENFSGCFRALAKASPSGVSRDLGSVFAFTTGLPLPMFNGCVASASAHDADVVQALDWLSDQSVPFSVWLPRPSADEVAESVESRGLVCDPRPMPGMVMHPIPVGPSAPGDLSIESVDASNSNDFAEVVRGLGLGDETAELLTAPSFLNDPAVDSFVGYVNRVPVSTSIAIGSVGASGVVCVLTLEQFRGRGFGSALTWAAIDAGSRHGHDTVVLQASPMGHPIYVSMGFTTVTEYDEFS